MAERFTQDQLGIIAMRFVREHVRDALLLEDRLQQPLPYMDPALQAEAIELYSRLSAEALAIAEAANPYTQRWLGEIIAAEFTRQRKERAAKVARDCVPS